MASSGYDIIRAKILETLMERENGTEIQPDKHQDFALELLDYIKDVELIGSSTLIGVAHETTVPVQPDDACVSYIAGVSPNYTAIFQHFYDSNGNPISVTTEEYEAKLVILVWNKSYWEATEISARITADTYILDGGRADTLYGGCVEIDCGGAADTGLAEGVTYTYADPEVIINYPTLIPADGGTSEPSVTFTQTRIGSDGSEDILTQDTTKFTATYVVTYQESQTTSSATLNETSGVVTQTDKVYYGCESSTVGNVSIMNVRGTVTVNGRTVSVVSRPVYQEPTPLPDLTFDVQGIGINGVSNFSYAGAGMASFDIAYIVAQSLANVNMYGLYELQSCVLIDHYAGSGGDVEVEATSASLNQGGTPVYQLAIRAHFDNVPTGGVYQIIVNYTPPGIDPWSAVQCRSSYYLSVTDSGVTLTSSPMH